MGKPLGNKAAARVAIAEDVLTQLGRGRIEAETRIYCHLGDASVETALFEACPDNDNPSRARGSVRPLLTEKLETEACSACAVGALFVSAVLVHDGLSFRQLFVDEVTTECRFLRRWFTERQIESVEVMFEAGAVHDGTAGWDGAAGYTVPELQLLRQHSSPRQRMDAIMRSIVALGGKVDRDDIKRRILRAARRTKKGTKVR